MTEPAAGNADDRRAIYEQDAEFVRYRDGVKWSRFQTASAVEAAALYVSFQVSGVSKLETILLMAFATVFIVLLFGLAIMDDRIIRSHLSRIRAFDEANGLPFPSTNMRPFFGFKTSRLLMAAIFIFNVAVILRLAGWPGGL